jgi:coenzyme F420 hydrogenase subunit beta
MGPHEQAIDAKTAPFLSIGFSRPSLCTRCGSCGGVCPTDAIDLTPDFFPRLRADRCTACGLCGKVCPGARLSYGDLAEQVFGERFVDRGFDGHVRAAYVGYAADGAMREGGSGGGVATALLAGLLKSGAVDGCLATRMKPDRPWEGEAFVARDVDELRLSQGSRYAVIPVNRVWASLRALPGRYAATMLPCQTHGYRLLQRHDPALAAKIEVVVGLFCGGALQPCLPEELLAARGIRREEVADFQCRGGEWPGRMQAVLRDGGVRPLHYSNYKDGAYNYFAGLYLPERCSTCLDGSCEFADIAVGDAWTRDARGEYRFRSHSRILVRTERGAALLRAAVDAGELAVTDVSDDPDYRTHKLQTSRKGRMAPLRVARWRRAGRAAPQYDRQAPADASARERLAERTVTALQQAGRWRWFRVPAMAQLTSRWAVPLIAIRLYLKKRRYARRSVEVRRRSRS